MDYTVEEAIKQGAKIKVIGCGGGGGNMVNHMIDTMGLSDFDLIVANTDAQALASSKAKTKIQLGEKKTKGLGAGMVPEIGAESARESYEEIKAALAQSDIVFIAAGLGGGTGTGAAPIIAQAAKEVGALTVSAVTMPFAFEGKQRKKLAEAGLLELKKETDSILVIQNQKLSSIIDRKLGFGEAFEVVDNVLARAVRGMISILLDNGKINVDFADVRTIMSYRGLALMGIGSGQGEKAMEEALANAIESPLLDGMDIKSAKGVICHFKTSSQYSFIEFSQAAGEIHDLVDEDAKIIMGTTLDDSLGDKVELTIIATGFEDKASQDNAKIKEQEPKKNPYINLNVKTGTFNSEEFLHELEIPTWMRNQMD